MFLSLITSRLAGPIASGVAVLLALLLLGSCVQVAGLKAKVERQAVQIGNLQVDLRQCRSNVVTMTDAVNRQNAAIQAAKAERDRVTREGEKAVQQARGVAESYRQRAERALRARPGADACADADRLILESLR